MIMQVEKWNHLIERTNVMFNFGSWKMEYQKELPDAIYKFASRKMEHRNGTTTNLTYFYKLKDGTKRSL